MIVDFSQSYPPAEAERGKFTVIDASTITGLPSASRGRYAVLTYNVGSTTTSPGASATNPIYVSPATTNVTVVSTVTFNNTLSTITFNPPATFLEVYNNDSTNKVYLSFNSITQVNTLTAQGLPLQAQGVYSIDKTVSNLIIGSNLSVTDARVFGHSIA